MTANASDAGTTGVYRNINCGMTMMGPFVPIMAVVFGNDLDMWFSPYSDTYRCECTPYDTYTAETCIRLAKQGADVVHHHHPNITVSFMNSIVPVITKRFVTSGVCSTAWSIPAILLAV